MSRGRTSVWRVGKELNSDGSVGIQRHSEVVRTGTNYSLRSNAFRKRRNLWNVERVVPFEIPKIGNGNAERLVTFQKFRSERRSGTERGHLYLEGIIGVSSTP